MHQIQEKIAAYDSDCKALRAPRSGDIHNKRAEHRASPTVADEVVIINHINIAMINRLLNYGLYEVALAL